MFRFSFVFATLLWLLTCCTGHETDERLVRIAAEVSASPNEALATLDSIDPRSLPDADRHFYDFLTVKASDKAYITHESDSLILSVVEYYSTQSKDTVYPEALYYAGRVYSDLGDYPTALDYFQKALDCLDAGKDNIDLRIRVLSQTGRLLNSLRLYDEAIPYIRSSLAIERQRNDTISIIYDLQLMGGILLRAERYPEAENVFNESLKLSNIYEAPERAAKSKMYLAAVKYETEQLDSALFLIRDTPETVHPSVRNSALAYASPIYLDAGILDTAYLYAHELINSTATYNHQLGYQVLLSPELRQYLNADSLDQYIADYRDLLETFYNENEQQSAINQQNLYNYTLHERQRAKAERSNMNLRHWVYGLVFLAMVMLLTIFYQKIKGQRRIIELQQAIENIKRLKQELNLSTKSKDIPQVNETDTRRTNPAIAPAAKTEKELGEELKNELLAMCEACESKQDISAGILQSEIFQTLQKRANDQKCIKENDPLWDELELTVLEYSPKFKSNLILLTSGNLTLPDLHTALLIKCGFKPSQMTILLGRSNGAIISRRETLCIKVLGKKVGVKVIDGIIRLL